MCSANFFSSNDPYDLANIVNSLFKTNLNCIFAAVARAVFVMSSKVLSKGSGWLTPTKPWLILIHWCFEILSRKKHHWMNAILNSTVCTLYTTHKTRREKCWGQLPREKQMVTLVFLIYSNREKEVVVTRIVPRISLNAVENLSL